jgi:hypothetical protein
MHKTYKSHSMPETFDKLKADLDIIADMQDGDVECIFVRINND